VIPRHDPFRVASTLRKGQWTWQRSERACRAQQERQSRSPSGSERPQVLRRQRPTARDRLRPPTDCRPRRSRTQRADMAGGGNNNPGGKNQYGGSRGGGPRGGRTYTAAHGLNNTVLRVGSQRQGGKIAISTNNYASKSPTRSEAAAMLRAARNTPGSKITRRSGADFGSLSTSAPKAVAAKTGVTRAASVNKVAKTPPSAKAISDSASRRGRYEKTLRERAQDARFMGPAGAGAGRAPMSRLLDSAKKQTSGSSPRGVTGSTVPGAKRQAQPASIWWQRQAGGRNPWK
jgi:hypothetical protein